MTHTVTLTSSELQVGMIVRTHGMRVKLDRPGRDTEQGGRAYVGLVLNRAEVPASEVPLGFTETASYPSRGLPAEPAGTHRWAIQGNDLAFWSVEFDSLTAEHARVILGRAILAGAKAV